MHAEITVRTPKSDADWIKLAEELTPQASPADSLLLTLLQRLRAAGAVSILQECGYIDRDFSSSYSEFYSTLFEPYRKFCRRVHFFSDDVAACVGHADVRKRVSALEALSDRYLGNIVIRPVDHAPVSSAHLAASVLAGGQLQEVQVKSRFKFHVMGVEFHVDAAPLTQQDTRTGACAQASIWMAGRHLHNRRGAPWFSVVDITKIALRPIDSGITRSLPAGSEWLTDDNIVRALRSMGRHPVTYRRNAAGNWLTPPAEVISRYLDSGIPVLLGLHEKTAALGHAVLAVGTERAPIPIAPAGGGTTAEFVTHFLVNDDQRGPYCRLAIQSADRGTYPFTIESDLVVLIVPLPDKVFMKAETAELGAVKALERLANTRLPLAQRVLGGARPWNVEPGFYDDVAQHRTMRRTYLTFGWRYKARAVRNSLSNDLKEELLETQFPRFVWVTEFYSPGGSVAAAGSQRPVMAHAVIDATGSRFSDSPLVLDAPGISLIWRYDPTGKEPSSQRTILADPVWSPSQPKIRGSF